MLLRGGRAHSYINATNSTWDTNEKQDRHTNIARMKAVRKMKIKHVFREKRVNLGSTS